MRLNTTKTLIASFLLSASFSFSQDVVGYEKVYYNSPVTEETDDFTFEAKSIVAQFDECKFGMKMTNNTSDYIMYLTNESTFNYEFGELNPNNKPIYIPSGKSRARTLKVTGSDKFLQSKFSFDIKGVYSLPTEGNEVEMEDFKLPASDNSVTNGNFKIVLKKYSASTKEAKASFEVTYTGEDVAIINASNLSVKASQKKTNQEVEYANDYKKNKIKLIQKGEKVKLTAVFHIPGKIVDMQFAEMFVQWNDTFVESKPVAIEGASLDFEMDKALTEEKK